MYSRNRIKHLYTFWDTEAAKSCISLDTNKSLDLEHSVCKILQYIVPSDSSNNCSHLCSVTLCLNFREQLSQTKYQTLVKATYVQRSRLVSAPVYRYCMMMFPCYWVVDNSDSPSIVEQSQQRCWLWLYSFIIPCFWLCGISYALCLLPSLLKCCWELFL